MVRVPQGARAEVKDAVARQVQRAGPDHPQGPAWRHGVRAGRSVQGPRLCRQYSNTVLLYSAPKGVVYGTIYERGTSTQIGEPPSEVAAALPKLWKTEWRQQR